MINCRDEDCNFEVILWTSSRYVASFCHSLTNSWSNKFSLSNSSHMCSILPNTFIKHLITILSQDLQLCLDQILFYTICPQISSKTRMPGKWGARTGRAPLDRQWTRMPGKWGARTGHAPLDPPMIVDKHGIPISQWALLCQVLLEVSMNKIALWINVCADDWRAKMSTIANNDLVTLCDFICRIIGRIMKKKWNSTTDPETG